MLGLLWRHFVGRAVFVCLPQMWSMGYLFFGRGIEVVYVLCFGAAEVDIGLHLAASMFGVGIVLAARYWQGVVLLSGRGYWSELCTE